MVSELTGKIFDIKRYAIHDGPGIRTTVFFKGCPLSCQWCHNPEGLRNAPKIIYEFSRCIGCGECIEACPEAAISMTSEGIATDRHRCKGCGVCVDLCPAGARELTERTITSSQLLEIIKKDAIFYDESGGGVTFSGGEPYQDFQKSKYTKLGMPYDADDIVTPDPERIAVPLRQLKDRDFQVSLGG